MSEIILLRNREIENLRNYDVYVEHGGFEALKKTLQMDPEDVITEVKDSNLRGRGGAGFPTGVKRNFMPREDVTKYVAVNADESEPGTFKDREIMEENPYQLLEGSLICAYAVGAELVYIYIRGEYWEIAEILDESIERMRAEGLLGQDILGSGFSSDMHVHIGAGAYICGEETALLNSLEGKRGQPRIKPPFPAQSGLYSKPTVVNNVETLANVPWIMEHGADAFKAIGTEGGAGTKIFSVSGCVNKPGNYELPLGITFRELFEIAGGITDGNQVKGILPAGASAAILPATDEILDMPLDYESLKPYGTGLGSASVIVLDETVDMAWAASKMVQFFAHESCGQCTPCREGTYWLERLYERIDHGDLDPEDVERMDSVAAQMQGKCICALGEFAVNPVMATIKHFREDYDAAVAAAQGSGDIPVMPETTPAGN
ncbi:MAG: NADH-quinone oxidoreductase subunit NuoF [Anaerolineae bacterium]